MAQPSRQDIRRDGFVYPAQGYELHWANMPDDDRLDLVEMLTTDHELALATL